MADFRRWITVLAVMALFVGLASAQVGTPLLNGSGQQYALGTPFTCSVQTTATPTLRSEGYAELTGDIVLVCTGGYSALPAGSVIPTTNIVVYYNSLVTSRLLGTNSLAGASEAVLLVDEPNDGTPNTSETGYGPSLPQILCSSPQYGAGPNGCVEAVGTTFNYNSTAVNTGVPVVQGTNSPGANMFQGIVNQYSVTFEGVPVLPPVTAGISRVYRITNVRVAANANYQGIAGVTGNINAQISTNSGTGGFQINNPNPTVAYVQPSLTPSVGNATTFPQCNSQSGTYAALLKYSEQFATAFKTRVDGQRGSPSFYSGGVSVANNYTTAVWQNTPGASYNSESGFIVNGNYWNGSAQAVLSNGSYTAGLADYGTRLKAVFYNVPAGMTVYASTSNIVLSGSSGANGIGPAPVPAGTTTASSYAVLLSQGAEGASDGTGTLPTASYTNSFLGPSTSGNTASWVNYVGITSQGNPIVFVWEVINTQPTFQETITFSTFINYTATATFPPTGSSTVYMGYAPNTDADPTALFSATNGGTTAVNNMIPRFAGSTFNSGIFTISPCVTTLLFPYVTAVTGFTTAIAIANTTTDPFKTTPQTGNCTLYFYDAPGAAVANVVFPSTGTIPSGGVLAADLGGAGYVPAGFSGYMIAVCNFELAHGIAEVTDLGSQHILSAYLALVVPTGTGARNSYSSTAPEMLNN